MSKPRVKRPAPRAFNMEDAVFAYFSVCCSELATKPALVKTPEAEGTLGSWRCGKCSKPCNVQRTKKVKQDAVAS